MAQKYKAVLTKIGTAKIAAATAGGTKINLTQMAVGDGGGTLPTPDSAQTKLIAEKHRAALNKVSVDAKHKNYLVAELVIPPEIGGFWMRELGLFDEVGDLIAVSNMAESYKPLLSEGSGRAQTLRMVVIVSDMDTVNLLIDSSTVLATQEYVDEKLLEHEQSRRHPDATLKEKGFTQLSSATNSTSEVLAATPKAVKTAYDLADGKYTAQDATTAQKGIAQLSSAINSDSETLAATPKAVKAVNDNANGRVPNARKINGHGLDTDISVTSTDIFDGQATNLGTNKNLNDVKTPGIYFQPMNSSASLALNYPEALAGALIVYKSADIAQEYRVYNSSRIYTRGQYRDGAWTAWAKEYNSLNKPTTSDIDAVSTSDIVQASGISKGKVMSQDACTRLFAGSASYGLSGGEPQIKASSGDYLFLSPSSYAGVKNKYGSVLWQFDPSGVLTNGTVPVARVSGLQQIGVGQSWQNLKSYRAFGATYTNTTGKPIVVSVSAILGENKNSVLTLNVDGVDVISSAVTMATYPVRGNVTAIVPPSATYRVNSTSVASLQYWAELR